MLYRILSEISENTGYVFGNDELTFVPIIGNTLPSRYQLSCLQIVSDDGNGDFNVGGNNDGPGYSWFDVGTMTSFLSGKFETCGHKNAFKLFPVNRRDPRHF